MYERIAPPCDKRLHKGSAGRIAVFGGSAVYTGAPYYAAMAALRSGSDLCSVFTVPEAAQVIKTYSPELMVAACSLHDGPVRDCLLLRLLPRLHAVVLGNGFGEAPKDLAVMSEIFGVLRESHTPIVVDADGIKAIALDVNAIRGHSMAILTPNWPEFKLLAAKVGVDMPAGEEALEQCVKRVAEKLHVTVVLKGAVDIISDGTIVMRCDVKGSDKRPGGLGDLLAGILGTLLPWYRTHHATSTAVSLPEVAWVGCTLMRVATRIAFERHGRGLTAPDVLEELPKVIPRP